jgi:ABC-2 type transport system permease protein
MATNLARRDVQDRSIEFWLSLPSTHTEHLGAQYLMHALVFPVAALLFGMAAGLLIAPLVLFKWMGMAAVTGAEWGAVLTWIGAMLLPALVALVLASLWLSPVVLGLMALSAWVKRLALPVLVVLATFLGNLPATRVAFREAIGDYGQRVGQLVEGVVALFASMGPAMMRKEMEVSPMQLPDYFQTAFGNLLSPAFAVSMAIALVSAYLLMQRRARGG